jgi:hypothetical protein
MKIGVDTGYKGLLNGFYRAVDQDASASSLYTIKGKFNVPKEVGVPLARYIAGTLQLTVPLAFGVQPSSFPTTPTITVTNNGLDVEFSQDVNVTSADGKFVWARFKTTADPINYQYRLISQTVYTNPCRVVWPSVTYDTLCTNYSISLCNIDPCDFANWSLIIDGVVVGTYNAKGWLVVDNQDYIANGISVLSFAVLYSAKINVLDGSGTDTQPGAVYVNISPGIACDTEVILRIGEVDNRLDVQPNQVCDYTYTPSVFTGLTAVTSLIVDGVERLNAPLVVIAPTAVGLRNALNLANLGLGAWTASGATVKVVQSALSFGSMTVTIAGVPEVVNVAQSNCI